ncbi:hypothetical protein NGM36_24915 [Streptomyces mutabilis]|nr:hypothetical protein [Streptomyces mutabilis]MCZ9352972.1 hypothetical protein [Streptomyces mutabilis]
MILAACFALAALVALAGLALVDIRTVPAASGMCALFLTFAALAVAMHR